MCKKGQVGTQGVHVNWAKWGCIYRRSLVQVFWSITKILSYVKCK
jgi:hypothetical protein